MQLKICLAVITLLGACNLLDAQTSAIADNRIIDLTSSEIPINEGDNWTFYLDSESKIYYIDFETISVNLSDVEVKNDLGETVLKDELWDLPVNTIYELDFTNFRSGKYKIELRSYTGMITREITIAD